IDLGVSGLPPPGVLVLPDRTVAELDPRPAAAGRCGREYGRYLLQGAGCGLRRPAGRTDERIPAAAGKPGCTAEERAFVPGTGARFILSGGWDAGRDCQTPARGGA